MKKYIVVHHSATSNNIPKSVIDGWKFYNLVVLPNGTVRFLKYELNKRAKDIYSWDVCLVGNFEKNKPKESQINTLKAHWDFEKDRFDGILSHSEGRDFGFNIGKFPTLCCGKNLIPFVVGLRKNKGSFSVKIFKHPSVFNNDLLYIIQKVKEEALKLNLVLNFEIKVQDFDKDEVATITSLPLDNYHCGIAVFRLDGGFDSESGVLPSLGDLKGNLGHPIARYGKVSIRHSPPDNEDIRIFIHELTHLILEWIDQKYNREQADAVSTKDKLEFWQLTKFDLTKIPSL